MTRPAPEALTGRPPTARSTEVPPMLSRRRICLHLTRQRISVWSRRRQRVVRGCSRCRKRWATEERP